MSVSPATDAIAAIAGVVALVKVKISPPPPLLSECRRGEEAAARGSSGFAELKENCGANRENPDLVLCSVKLLLLLLLF